MVQLSTVLPQFPFLLQCIIEFQWKIVSLEIPDFTLKILLNECASLASWHMHLHNVKVSLQDCCVMPNDA